MGCGAGGGGERGGGGGEGQEGNIPSTYIIICMQSVCKRGKGW